MGFGTELMLLVGWDSWSSVLSRCIPCSDI